MLKVFSDREFDFEKKRFLGFVKFYLKDMDKEEDFWRRRQHEQIMVTTWLYHYQLPMEVAFRRKQIQELFRIAREEVEKLAYSEK